jgi:hypothetical protein
MIDFDFEIAYKKGSEMPADYLSRNHVDAITLDDLTIRKEQDQDPDFQALRNYLLHGAQHPDPSKHKAMAGIAESFFVDNGILWKGLNVQMSQAKSC